MNLFILNLLFQISVLDTIKYAQLNVSQYNVHASVPKTWHINIRNNKYTYRDTSSMIDEIVLDAYDDSAAKFINRDVSFQIDWYSNCSKTDAYIKKQYHRGVFEVRANQSNYININNEYKINVSEYEDYVGFIEKGITGYQHKIVWYYMMKYNNYIYCVQFRCPSDLYPHYKPVIIKIANSIYFD